MLLILVSKKTSKQWTKTCHTHKWPMASLTTHAIFTGLVALATINFIPAYMWLLIKDDSYSRAATFASICASAHTRHTYAYSCIVLDTAHLAAIYWGQVLFLRATCSYYSSVEISSCAVNIRVNMVHTKTWLVLYRKSLDMRGCTVTQILPNIR